MSSYPPVVSNRCKYPPLMWLIVGWLSGSLFLGGSSVTASPDECLDYSPFAHWVSGVSTFGVAEDVAIHGSHAYVANGHAGLTVIDVSDPQRPWVNGLLPLPGQAVDVAIDSTRIAGLRIACVAAQAGGLQLIDVTESDSPQVLGQLLLPGLAMGVAVRGEVCFVAAGSAGLQVVNISNPAAPAVMGQLIFTDEALSVAMEGSLAVIAASDAGFIVVDVSDPTAPRKLGTCGSSVSAAVTDMAMAYPFAYGVDYFTGLKVIDLADPFHPAIVGAVPPLVIATGIAVAGDRAFIAEGYSGIQIVDIADPRAPRALGRLGVTEYACAVAVFDDGANVLVPDGAGVQVAFVGSGVTPLPTASAGQDHLVTGVAVQGSRVYLSEMAFTGGGGYLAALDLSADDPRLGEASLPGPAQDLAIVGSHACVALASTGLAVVDLSDPGRPALVKTFQTPGIALDVLAANSNLLVAAHHAGLLILDASDPTALKLRAQLDVGGPAWGVAVSGDVAFLATENGLAVVDIKRPDSPEMIVSMPAPMTRDVAVSGGRAYMVGQSGLRIIDVSNPRLPVPQGALETGDAHDVVVHGSHAYIADGRVGVQVVDVTDPHAPLLVGGADTPSEALGLAIGPEGILVADGTCSDTGCWGGVYVYPQQCVSATLGTEVAAVIPPLRGMLAGVRPNPLRLGEGADFPIEMAQGGRARLRIFDVAGRLVRVLFDGSLSSGSHLERWDGRDTGGQRVAPGVYFGRLEGDGFEAAQRLTILR